MVEDDVCLHKLSTVFTYITFRKRKRRTDVVVVRGRLRLYSVSGFFLLLGLVILAIGIGMATLGYWPHSETMPSAKSKTATAGGAKTSSTGGGNGAKVSVTEGDVANSSTSHDVQGKKITGWLQPGLCS